MIIFANYDNYGQTIYRRNHGEIYDKIEVVLPDGWKEINDTPLFDLEAPWGDLYSTIDAIIDDHGPCLFVFDDKGEPYKRELKRID